ncbi:beta-L-arabinofuranosidase domain-containing protein, partial [Flavihumibacter sp. CACIAM 22H1]|uniref:beta-L-arabinofuranosidase domain-containing protein n=1 Tax=Flavihumibacter sp. CACIAM 22H1 TaxID=1812911 RepID=UPI0007A914C7
TNDWSRNNLHGKLQQDTAVRYFNDPRFGKVASLTGIGNSYITLPSDVVKEMESFSISTWILPRSGNSIAALFSIGRKNSPHFSFNQLNLPGIELNKWTHIALVIDPAAKTMVLYVNSKQAGAGRPIPAELEKLTGQLAPENTPVYIGKTMLSQEGNLNALLHDFRIYRVPLSNAQVTGIFNSAQRGLNDGSVNVRQQQQELPVFAPDYPQLYTAYLLGVEDCKITTRVGHLPRLPAYLKATYRPGINGPKVKVIWPAAIDNAAVLKPGQYVLTGRIAGTRFQPKAIVTIVEGKPAETPQATLELFALDRVDLLPNRKGQPTKFIENRDKFINTLAKTDPNSFLYMFRHAFAQPQPPAAQPLGVWDSKDTKLRGHATGHYMTAIAQAYASTGYDKKLQANFAGKMDTMINTLYSLSRLSGNDPAAVPPGPGKSGFDSDLSDSGIRKDYQNWGRGFISAYPPDQFIMLEKGAKYGGQVNQVWAPYYTLHKLLAGLLDIYEVSGNKKALEIATGMADWVYARLSKIPADTLTKIWNTYIAGEYGGMNEVMARLYKITQRPHYLRTAQLFDNIKLFYGDSGHSHGLAKNVDLFRGLHANQHIPQVVGSMEMYRVSNQPDYYQIADNFWYKVVNDYMYSIGGVAGARNPANAECFVSQPGTLYENGLSLDGQNETCATYNMLKLTNQLFLYNQQARYMDYYERGLYNHILASVAENSPANTYHVPLNPGAVKHFGNPAMTGFTCCNGTSIETNTKLQQAIYLRSADNRSLYVNLFIPSVLDWKERGIRVEQATNFPEEEQTSLTIKGNGKFSVFIRVPGWATNGFLVSINGKTQNLTARPGTYLEINRSWKNGDCINLRMPFNFWLDPVIDQQNIASLFYGPILLAAQETAPGKEWRKIRLPVKEPGKNIKATPSSLEFYLDGILFKPFYNTYGRHSVYLDVLLTDDEAR